MARTAVPFFTTDVTASPAGAGETVIATLHGCTVSYPSDRFVIEGFANITLDANVTAIVLAVRRTDISGTLVSDPAVTPKAAGDFTGATFQVVCSDAPGDVAGLTYVLTATLTAAGGASTVNDVALIASLTS